MAPSETPRGIARGLVVFLAVLQGGIEWQSSHDDALAKAKSSKNLALVYAWTDFCGFCTKMESETFANDGVVEAMKAYVCVKLDAAKSEKVWKETYKGQGTPTIFVVTGEGEILGRFAGYRPPKEFAELLKAIPDRVKRLRDAQAEVAKDVEDTRALMDLAGAHHALENEEAAAGACERIVRLLETKEARGEAETARLANAAVELARIRYEQERWDEVLQYAAVHAKADPKDAGGRGDEVVPLAAGAKFLGQRKVDEAIAILRAGIERFPKSKRMDQMRFLEGLLLREKGEEAGAKRIWKGLAESGRENEWTKRAKAELGQ